MNEKRRSFLTLVLALSVLTALGGGTAAQPSADNADVSPSGFDAGATNGLDHGDSLQSVSWDNDTNGTVPCYPYPPYGYICW